MINNIDNVFECDEFFDEDFKESSKVINHCFKEMNTNNVDTSISQSLYYLLDRIKLLERKIALSEIKNANN